MNRDRHRNHPWSRGALLLALAGLSACSADGCGGVKLLPVPGGFPQKLRVDNAIQARVTSGGLAHVAANLGSHFKTLYPGGMPVTIPPTNCGQLANFCCTPAKCLANLAFHSAAIVPGGPTTLRASITLGMATNKMRWQQKLSMGCCGSFCPPMSCMSYTVKCDASYSTPALKVVADIDFQVPPSEMKKLSIKYKGSAIHGFKIKDMKLSGADAMGQMYCAGASVMKNMPFISSVMQKQITKSLNSALQQVLTKMLAGLTTGTEGRVAASKLLAVPTARAAGAVDLFQWAGGYARTHAGGLSLGVIGGFRAAGGTSPCVPDCEKPGAACAPPKVGPITFSKTFTQNTSPGGKAYHMGFGVHRRTLDSMLYAMYRSGSFCLDVGTDATSKAPLTSAAFAKALPSLARLTGGRERPAMISMRPTRPFVAALRHGTGKLAGAPLVVLVARDLAVDLWVSVDRRLLRVAGVRGDFELPVRIKVTAKGQLQPALEGKAVAVSNAKLDLHPLVTESPKTILAQLPALMDAPAAALARALGPMDVPGPKGIKLAVDAGSVALAEPDAAGAHQVLGVFARMVTK